MWLVGIIAIIVVVWVYCALKIAKRADERINREREHGLSQDFWDELRKDRGD